MVNVELSIRGVLSCFTLIYTLINFHLCKLRKYLWDFTN